MREGPTVTSGLAGILTCQSITDLAREVGADPREMIPCKPRTKVPLVKAFNGKFYAMNWDRFLKGKGAYSANVALLFGKHSGFVGIDCDAETACEKVRDLIGTWMHVRTARGVCLLARSHEDVANITASGVLKLKIGGEDAGELRLQHCFSLIQGIHPSGRAYEVVKNCVQVVSLSALVADLKSRGFEVPPLAPPRGRDDDEITDGTRYWVRQAESCAESADSRKDETVATHDFVFRMTMGLRLQPELAPDVVDAFAEGVRARGLCIRGAQDRLLNELKKELVRWGKAFGNSGRTVHQPLKDYWIHPAPKKTEQEVLYLLFRFLNDHGVRKDQRDVLAGLVAAFARRARKTENKWAYEATTALAPEIPPSTFSRVVGRAADLGLLEREENDLPSTLPPQMTAKWKYRVTQRAFDLIPQ